MKRILSTLIPALFLMQGCLDIPDEIIVPEWDVDVNIPMANRTYTINDILKEQENLSIEDPDSVYILHTREYTQNRNLLDFIKLDGAVSQDNLSLSPVNASRDIYLPFRTDVVVIDSAVFSDGFFNINVRNQSSLNLNFRITIPGITLNKSVLEINIPLAPGEIKEIRQELAGYKYSEPLSQPPALSNSLWVNVESQAAGTNNGGNVQFDVEISDFFFSSVSGMFAEQDIGRKTDTIEAHIGENLDDFRNKVTLKTAVLKLSALYQSKFNNPFSLKVDSLTLRATHNGEELYLTDSSGSRYINFVVTQGNINIEFNETNSNIIDIINFIPDVFEISASFRILGNNQSGTITNEDISNITIDINTKSILALERSTLVDTFTVIIDEQDRERIRDAQFSVVEVDIMNAIPVKSWLRVDFVNSDFNHLFTLRIDNADTAVIDGAVVNNATGEVTLPFSYKRTVELSREDIINLSETRYILMSVDIETSAYKTPDPVLVTLRASDWLKISLYAQVKYHIDTEDI